MSPPQASSWECFTGWWLKTGIIIPWETGIIQMLLLREAAVQIPSEEQAGTTVMEAASALLPLSKTITPVMNMKVSKGTEQSPEIGVAGPKGGGDSGVPLCPPCPSSLLCPDLCLTCKAFWTNV